MREQRPALPHHFRHALKSPIVMFTLAALVIVLIAAPLFAILDPSGWRG